MRSDRDYRPIRAQTEEPQAFLRQVALSALEGVVMTAEESRARYVAVYVEFDEEKRTYDYFVTLHERLEELVGRRVDLVTDRAAKLRSLIENR